MSRKELYAQIVKLNLQDKVKEKWGTNYTNCKNAELLEVINVAIIKTKSARAKAVTESPKCSCKRLETLVNILKERHLLLQSDVEKIMNA
jgi:hypothetical protein